ncbi:MAG: SRPBCC family protein [Burkholderiaceae bacterium]|nr:SRPBCC family protein [Burkholderiaceae bacterium]
MLNMVIIAIVVIVAVVLALAAGKPDVFRVERSANIKAPADKVFALINDFHNWPAWSPWEKLDPAMQRTYSGAARGVGAGYAWEGNKQVGKGSMEIMESSPTTKISIKLDFFLPFEAHNTAEFTMQTHGDLTSLTWAMYGPSPFMMKLMHVFMPMDRMVGKDFEEGLNNLKTIAER